MKFRMSIAALVATAALPASALAVDSAFFPKQAQSSSHLEGGGYFGAGYVMGATEDGDSVTITSNDDDEYLAPGPKAKQDPEGLRISWGYQGETIGFEGALIDAGEVTFKDDSPQPGGTMEGATQLQGIEAGMFGAIPFDEHKHWRGIIGFGLAYFEGSEEWSWKEGDKTVTESLDYENQTPFYRLGVQYRGDSASVSLDHRVYLRGLGAGEREFSLSGVHLNYHY